MKKKKKNELLNNLNDSFKKVIKTLNDSFGIIIKNRKYIFWYLIQLFSLLVIFLNLVLILFSTGSELYERLLFIATLLFVIGLIHIKESKDIKHKYKINLILTLAIAFFALSEVWTAFYGIIPRVYTPGIKCPEHINVTSEGYGNFSVFFGNYGELPAWLTFDFQSTTESLSTVGETKYTIVLIPIAYRENKQDEFNFKFRVNTYTQTIGFKLKHLVYGDDIIDKTWAYFKKKLDIYNELPCEYSNVNNITYSLIH